jgi:membrane protein
VGLLNGLDRAQRRFPPLGVPIAVFYKYYDDQGNYLVAAMTYYAFIAIFPLLLLASSILGFILQGNESLQERVLNSALGQFPIIGDQLGRPEGLEGSTSAIVVGVLVALFGASGLGQAIQNTMNAAWAVPRNSRPNPFVTRFKSLVLLTFAGLAVLAVSVLSTLGANTEVFGDRLNATIRWLILAASVVLVGLVLTGLSRLASARHHYVGRSWPGAFTVALLWQGLQHLGTIYATTVLASADDMNETFALVLGLMGLIYLAAIIGVLGIEINVVLARRLWPRSLLTLFTDNVDLTDADRRTYAGLVQVNTLKGFESVVVRFDERNGETHEIVLGPKTPPNGMSVVSSHSETGSRTVPTERYERRDRVGRPEPVEPPVERPAEPEKTQPIRTAGHPPDRSGTNR